MTGMGNDGKNSVTLVFAEQNGGNYRGLFEASSEVWKGYTDFQRVWTFGFLLRCKTRTDCGIVVFVPPRQTAMTVYRE